MSDNPDGNRDRADSLAQLRGRIDELNAQLVTLLGQRAAAARDIGKLKGDGPVYVPGRETAVLEQVTRLNRQQQGLLADADLQAVFKEIIAACRAVQQRPSVHYLGPAGTYSQEAARSYFGSACTFVAEPTIQAVFQATEYSESPTALAVVPVENSTEGPVVQTLDLLRTSILAIRGEVDLPVHHQLLSASTSLDSVRTIAAHPQALSQCRQWLQANLPHARQRAMLSNAQAAAWATKASDRAAIASRQASKEYSVPILAANIEDEPHNTTRFVVLSRASGTSGNDATAGPTGNDRTSIVCAVPNRAGALQALLSVFAAAGVNITKLDSRPVRNEPWQYVFYMDLDGHHMEPTLHTALEAVRRQATYVKMLGSYPKAS